jgi:hypothetical protein
MSFSDHRRPGWIGALLVAALLCSCGPDPCERAARSPDPASAAAPGPLDRWPLLQVEDWPTPRGPWQGGGRAWQARVGAAASDYPGTAALIAPPGHPGAQLTLLTPSELAAVDACSRRPEGADDWLGVAVRLQVGGPGACGDREACWTHLEGLLDGGASLVLAEGLGELPPSEASLGPWLGWKTRQRVDLSSTLQQLGAVVPARAEGLLQRAEQAHLVVLDGAAVDLFDRGALRLLDAVVRATGRRPVLRYPFDSAGSSDPGSEERDLVLLGLHLALGGALLVDGPEPLPARLEGARAWLRRHPELVHRTSSTVDLFFDPLQPGGEAPVALGRSLDAGHVPWEVVVRPPGRLRPTTMEFVRVQDAPLAALSDVGIYPDLRALVPREPPHLHLVAAEEDECRPVLDAAVLASGGRVLAVDKDGAVEPSHVRYEAARIDTDLPSTVQIIRTIAPHRGLVVHHLLNRDFDGSGRAVPVASARLVAPARQGLGDRSTCQAAWHLPGEQRSQELPCTVAGDGQVAVQLPSFSTWAVVTTRLLPEDRSARFGEHPIRVVPPGSGWQGTTVPFEVPFLAADLAATLSLPELLHMKNREPLAVESMEHEVEVSPDGASVRLVSEGSGLRLERELSPGVDHVDVTLTLTNTGDEVIEEALALICLATRAGSPFPESGHNGTFIVEGDRVTSLGEVPVDNGDPLYREDRVTGLGGPVLPLTVMRSVDDRYSLGTGFEGSDVVGGNGARGGVCLHARPRFGDIAPGASVTRRGTIYISQDGVDRLAQRWVEQHGGPGTGPEGEPWRPSQEVCAPADPQ